MCAYSAFWMKNEVSERYRHIYLAVILIFVALPSSCLVERGFSGVINLLTKQRNCLQIATKGDLRLYQRANNVKEHIFQLFFFNFSLPQARSGRFYFVPGHPKFHIVNSMEC